MLLMVEKGIRGRICHAIHRYAKANNKYMKNYDKNIDSSYLIYLDANNLYGWGMSQRLRVNGFEWMKQLSEFDERFIKNYDENSDKRYILKVDVKYPKNLFTFHKDFPFLAERKKIEKCKKHKDFPFLAERKKIEKCKKLVCNIHDKEPLRAFKSLKTSIKS